MTTSVNTVQTEKTTSARSFISDGCLPSRDVGLEDLGLRKFDIFFSFQPHEPDVYARSIIMKNTDKQEKERLPFSDNVLSLFHAGIVCIFCFLDFMMIILPNLCLNRFWAQYRQLFHRPLKIPRVPIL